MKKIIFLLGILGVTYSYAQINVQSDTNPTIGNQNPFLDASGYVNKDNSIAKGLVFPRTDLTKFVFNTSLLGNYQNFPTAFDGMIVYNTGEGTVNANGTESATKGKKVDVKPGFYYFSNPLATEDTNDVSGGIWVRIGDGSANAYTVAGSQVATGTFTHDGGITAVLANMPTDVKAITGIKIVRTDDNGDVLSGGVAATTFYSYEKATKKIAFGQGAMATSMPAGTYSYTVEYTK